MEVNLQPGTYYLEVRGSNQFEVGSYKLHIDGQGIATTADRDDHGFSVWNATPVNVGSVTTGILELANDKDYFKFTISTAGKYVIYTRGPTATSSTLYRSDYNTQTSISAFSGSGETGNFRMEVNLIPGSYYLEVRGSNQFVVGSYNLCIDSPILTSLTITGPALLYASTIASYSATASWGNSPTTTVTATWSVSPTTYASISADGNLTTLAVPDNLTVTISASFTAFDVTKTATKLVTINKDTSSPTITNFTLPATSVSLTVPVTFTATDNVSVTGYLLTETSTIPTSSTAGWSATAPTSFTFSTPGSKTLYAWAKDKAGNVSNALSKNVTITQSVNGTCGTSNGGTFAIIPTTNLCSTGNSSAVTGTIQVRWSCVGLNGGSTTLCAATIDVTGATLNISTLANNAITNNKTLNISGTVSDPVSIASLTINGASVAVSNGSFSTAITLQSGNNTVTVVASDSVGNVTTNTRIITLDQAAPILNVAVPADNSTTTQAVVTITGTVNETATVSIRINNGSPQSAEMTGNTFSAAVNLTSGINTIDITATDQAGNISTAKRSITYDNGALSLSVTYPNQDTATTQGSITISGNVMDAVSNVVITITADGQTYTPAVAQNGSFSQNIHLPTDKTYAVVITATDQIGNSTTAQRNIIKLTPLTQPSLSDALKVFQAVTGITTLTPAELILYDVAPLGSGGNPQGNGVIDAADVILILRRSIGIGSW
jgi:hypothetical protein